MHRWIFVMLVAAGCGDGRSSAADAPGAPADAADAETSDAPVDAVLPPDAAVCQPRVEPPSGCFGTTGIQVCLASVPTQALTLSDMTIDTGNSAMCATVTSASGTYCVLAATDITVDGAVRAIGPYPLVFLATGSISIAAEGSIDVGSHRAAAAGEEVGAGADPATCETLPASVYSRGGAGGSGAGAGGLGSTELVGAIRAGDASAHPRAALVNALRGGCPGQASQQQAPNVPDPATTRGSGGHGGGATYLIAASGITIGGKIDATGEGGVGGGDLEVARSFYGGGGGGGSGGVIGLEAQTVAVTGLLLASGAGGGGGSGVPSFTLHEPGEDGHDPTDLTPALGGFAGRSSTRSGGPGSPSAIDAPGGDAKQAIFGEGSGGGGGAGLIVAPATADLGTELSPPATRLCP